MECGSFNVRAGCGQGELLLIFYITRIYELAVVSNPSRQFLVCLFVSFFLKNLPVCFYFNYM